MNTNENKHKLCFVCRTDPIKRSLAFSALPGLGGQTEVSRDKSSVWSIVPIKHRSRPGRPQLLQAGVSRPAIPRKIRDQEKGKQKDECACFESEQMLTW